ncbi:MAG: restriction endonuclease subunit S [Phycisphaerales bacterium]|nr:restriction endonuclease subunit S [Planctomycetota bacterium]MCH8507149.1 restriction endonuclease subunit S [Phycisphaerales bacterium]
MANLGAHFQPLATLCVPKNGLQTGPFGSQLHASDYVAEGIPVVMPQDIRAGRIRTDKVARVSPETAERLGRHRLRLGDIVFSRRGDVSRYAIVRDREAGFLCGTGCLRARLSGGIEPDYMAAVLEAGDAGRWLTDNAVGQTMPNLNVEIVGELPVPMLDAAGQTLCTRVLRVCRSAEARYARVVASKRLLLRGLMQQLLAGRRRVPAFAGEAREMVRLRDVLKESTKRNRGALASDSVMAVNKFHGLIPMRERTIADDLGRYKIVPPDAFAYNPMRVNIGSIARSGFEHPVLVSPDYVVFECSGCDAGYLDHLRRSDLWRRHMVIAGNGSVRVRIYFNDLAQMKVMLPSLAEQRAIADILDTAHREIELLEQLREQIQLQKRALMQKLLTGEIRVPAEATRGS